MIVRITIRIHSSKEKRRQWKHFSFLFFFFTKLFYDKFQYRVVSLRETVSTCRVALDLATCETRGWRREIGKCGPDLRNWPLLRSPRQTKSGGDKTDGTGFRATFSQWTSFTCYRVCCYACVCVCSTYARVGQRFFFFFFLWNFAYTITVQAVFFFFCAPCRVSGLGFHNSWISITRHTVPIKR